MEESSLQQQSTLLAAIAVITLTICYPFVLRFYHWLVGGSHGRTSNGQEDRHRHRSATLLKMEAAYFTRRHVPGVDQTFTLFCDLGEDLMTHVLSFVAEAPFEVQDDSFMAALTHSLPFVSKQFYRLTKTNDDFWKAAILRQVAREAGGAGGLWNEGLQSLSLAAEEAQPTNNASSTTPTTTATTESVAQLVDRICQSSGTTCAEIYKTILNTTIRFTGPIFCMPQRLKLGVPYGLHFFEPRYRRLIADIMAPFSATARQGGPIVGERDTIAPPVFIHAHAHARLERGTPACLVQVIRCHIYPDGRADVFLMPYCHVRTELLWEVPNTGHLYCGQFMRLGRGAESEQQAAGAALRRYGQY